MNKRVLNKSLFLVKKILLVSTFFICIMLTSCVTAPVHKTYISRNLTASGILTATQLAQYFKQNNPDSDFYKIKQFAQLYIDEGAMENINSDIAFAQMCLETGYLTYGNLVTPDMNNFCGLGAMDAAHPGERFHTPQLGVRAHIQHLQAYATTPDTKLNNPQVDPRYNWVHKTKYIKTVHELAGTWAMDPDYGKKLDNILFRMEEMIN